MAAESMEAARLAFSEDLPAWVVASALLLAVGSLGLLGVEARRRGARLGWLAVTGVLGVASLLAAVLRPVRITSSSAMVGPKVVVLLDGSRRLGLPASQKGERTRREVGLEVVRDLGRELAGARLELLELGNGAPEWLQLGAGAARRLAAETDLAAALGQLAGAAAERPSAAIVISDGRFARPTAELDDAALRAQVGTLGVPIHTVQVADGVPSDAAVRDVRAAGAAVAHQPLVLSIEVACTGALRCGQVPVVVEELRYADLPAELARGRVDVGEDGQGKVELEVTLERAGTRVVRVRIESPEGDQVAANDSRMLTFEVARDRVRLLHLAGRPTYDVRALRTWLEADEAVDVVAFFIMRTDDDDLGAGEDELALIKFPVDELFTTHLPSFDAIVLQDIDAVQYKLAQYLPALASYVEGGGGLIMVGGPSSFAGGKYARTELDRVLPVAPTSRSEAYDPANFVPRYTVTGRAAPALRPLRELLALELPEMPGANLLGPARPGALVLLEHPSIFAGDAAMPVLALGAAKDGRSIALGVDGTHLLAFSEFAASVAGRAYGALWDGLLGWLMRDPRYEGARVSLDGECIAGERNRVEVSLLPGVEGEAEVWLEPLGVAKPQRLAARATRGPEGRLVAELDGLEPGGYAVRVRVGHAPPTRQDIACERGGAAWGDVRPDPERLRRVSSVTGGRSVTVASLSELEVPAGQRIAAERHVQSLLPPWAWSLAASVMLGVHWLVRRRSGLA